MVQWFDCYVTLLQVGTFGAGYDFPNLESVFFFFFKDTMRLPRRQKTPPKNYKTPLLHTLNDFRAVDCNQTPTTTMQRHTMGSVMLIIWDSPAAA